MVQVEMSRHFARFDEAVILRDSWRERGMRVVFTNGCFDLLHPGHVSYLESARALGDILMIGLNSDDSIRQLKGESRPINSLADRAAMLAALSSVDLVVPFPEQTPIKLIEAVVPDVLVKGGDYAPDNIVGAGTVRAAGGEVIVIPFLDGYSSTNMIEKIQKLSI